MIDRDPMEGTPVREVTSRGRRVAQTNHFSHESKQGSDAIELQVIGVTLAPKPLGLVNTSDMPSATPGGPEEEDELDDLESDNASPGEDELDAQSPQSPVEGQSPQSPVNPPTPEEGIATAVDSD